MLTLFPELDLPLESPEGTAARTKRPRKSKRRNQVTYAQSSLPFELSARSIRLLYLGGRRRDDPRPREIAELCRQIRKEQEFLQDAGPKRRDGYEFAALFAEATLRYATLTLHAWSRRWQSSVDRQTKADDGRDYRKLLSEALLAIEWLEGCDEPGTQMSFRDACDILAVNEERMREQIWQGMSGMAVIWLGAIAGIEECCRDAA